MWDSANGQKNAVRLGEKDEIIKRNNFPQVPWQAVKNPKFIKTDAGDKIMVDGWFAIVRKPNYVPDMFFSLAWGSITGFT
jgi:delta24(24(1))-sterol reductase